MYKFALVDDEIVFLKILDQKLSNILFEKHIEYHLSSFNQPTSFLKTLSQENYDIVFLDIDMPNENGIDIARRLRNIDHPPVVIFVTSKEKYMRDAFGMNVFAFIVKEKMNEELAPIMTDCLTYLEKNNVVTLKTNQGLHRFYFNDIICVYSEDRKIQVITHLEVFQIYQETLGSIVQKLNHPQFVSPNRGSIVNLRNVSNTRKGCITLEHTNHKEYISRERIKEFDRIFTNYVLGQRIYQ
ncbi:LytR/AlgR family response regulator transcription factor [Sharpea azabuensis]|uniref:LytR/AlgR family response regulator transcription factor n=1 Tax=Sharpea azabuensis TaxID=322505 RepID=UPI00240976A6|nr:LytTR family DNA-binding domain-containing protein [Sharpea azabuensis]MDD6513505.1 LytTR family DNA-binding domain-containing protein [Sharpea azabuensis]